MKPSTGAAVRDHRNAVRDGSESLSAINRNPCPQSPESAHTAPKDRSRAIDRYARAAGLSPESDEALVLEAMRRARFSIIGFYADTTLLA